MLRSQSNKNQNMNLKASLFLTAICLFTIDSFSQDGSLDPTFGMGGIVTTSIGSSASGNAMALQPDGKIIMAGSIAGSANNSDFALARYNPDGTFDAAFGASGIVTSDMSASDGLCAVAVQSDNKIVVAGTVYINGHGKFIVMRYLSDGSVDNTFGNSGSVITVVGSVDAGAAATCMVIQPDGKIVVGGAKYAVGQTTYHSFGLVRYNTDGTLDTTFGNAGIVIVGSGRIPQSLALLPNGKILIGGQSTTTSSGYDFILSCINSNGVGLNFDVTTNFNGIGGGALKDIAIQPDGKIVAVGIARPGTSNFDFAMARYNSSGTLDTSFGTGGKIVTDFENSDDSANAVIIQNDNKILVVGSSYYITQSFAVARYSSNGSLDQTFDDDGKVLTYIASRSGAGAVLLQTGGKILVGGSSSIDVTISNFTLVRYNGTPLSDSDFTVSNPTHIFPNPVSAHGTLFSNTFFDDVSVDIFNSIGQQLRHIDHFSGDRIALNPIDFTEGLYYIRIAGQNKMLYTSKFSVKN